MEVNYFMKSFVRWTATLALIGGTVMTSWLGSTLKVLALPQEQILQKLNDIPVFLIGDDKGGVFLSSGENNKTVLFAFFSQQDAQKNADQLAKKNPNQKVQVLPLPLSAIYKMAKEKTKAPGSPDLYSFIPVNNEVQSALTLVRQQDPKADKFQGVPLFYATLKQDGKEVFLSFKQGEQSFTPFYFEKEALQTLVENFKKQQPNLAATVEIKVLPLQNLLASFENDKSDDFTKTIVLVPSRESEQFLQKVIQQQQQSNPSPQKPSQPSANPAPTSPQK
jgi:hypothetical protein